MRTAEEISRKLEMMRAQKNESDRFFKINIELLMWVLEIAVDSSST